MKLRLSMKEGSRERSQDTRSGGIEVILKKHYIEKSKDRREIGQSEEYSEERRKFNEFLKERWKEEEKEEEEELRKLRNRDEV